jgi:hypothetical protein
MNNLRMLAQDHAFAPSRDFSKEKKKHLPNVFKFLRKKACVLPFD